MGNVEKVSDVLGKLMQGLSSESAGELDGAWSKVVSSGEREHSSAVSLKDGRLTVLVDNPVHLQELVLKRKKIMDDFNVRFPLKKVSEIRFKIGVVD